MKLTRILAALCVLASIGAATSCSKNDEPAKYVFLFIGDGMGIGAVSSLILSDEAPTGFELAPVIGLSETSSADNHVSDSPAGGTALAAGVRTINGHTGVDPDGKPLTSILYKAKPSEVKLIMIDPKVVELKLYNNIPHLLTPVITDPKRAFQALQYCICEMERRYALLDGMGVRDITNYNHRIKERNIATEKLPYIVVIIDEFSMVDIWLFKKLIDAIDFNHTKLLMIGDNAQLPSVSCGNLLHDFMEANIIPTVTLNKIFRYSSGGLMKVATDTRCCQSYLDNSMKNTVTVFGDNKDYTFVDLASALIPKNVVGLYKKLLNDGNSIEDIQVLTAKNIGDCGSIELNNMIQRVANPNYGSEVNMKVGDTTYYEGDLILQCVNNYQAELDEMHLSDDDRLKLAFNDEPLTAFVANGETGIIKEIYNTYIIADFNGVYVKYYRKDMNMVKLGYAISIHKSQGGGFKTVILCTPQSHIFMLNSNLLYVGLTRMKEKLYHLGSLQSVNQAVKKKANLTRHTFMQNLLKST